MTRKEVFTIIGLVLLWRALLFGLSLVADCIIPYAPTFSKTLIEINLEFTRLPRWLYSFANFDGVHYLTIGREGYKGIEGIQAFFPLFPRVILGEFFHIIGATEHMLLYGLVLTTLFSLGFFLILFQLLKETFSARIALLACVSVLVFPTSFFLVSLYTESLFLLLTILSFYCAHHKRWVLASVCVALASATRVVGIFLIPALLFEYLQVTQHRKAKDIIALLLGSVGLFAYMGYLWKTFQDPFLFAHVQSSFGAGRSTTISLYPQVAWRALKILLTSQHTIAYVTYIEEFIAGVFGAIAVLWSAKYVKASWTIFAVLCFFFPPLSGTFSSMSRYILVCFPIFLLVAKRHEKHARIILFTWILSFLLLCLNTVLFLQGYWVA